jgi:hypothetical protein
MIPAELKADDFKNYSDESRDFAVHYIETLRRMPVAVCPSFLLQIRNVPTNFPAETRSLRTQLDALKAMPATEFNAHTEVLRGIRLSNELLRRDWVNDPATFITVMTAHLWSSGQIDDFRNGTRDLFAALPVSPSKEGRLIIVVMGQDAKAESNFGRLRKLGLLVQKLDEPDVPGSLMHALEHRATADPEPYAHWYIDGGAPWESRERSESVTSVSYRSLSPLRMRVLGLMKDTVFSSDAGAEAMQTRLSNQTPEALHASEITADKVLQRFYTELFTLSSGPQLFSTSFVQWTGRELMRRAQPKTVLLRYAPRQHHRSFNEMVGQVEAETVLDPEGSLRDAEMGAYYALLEARRVVAPEQLTFLVWLEGTSKMLVIAPGAPAGTEMDKAISLEKVLTAFS